MVAPQGPIIITEVSNTALEASLNYILSNSRSATDQLLPVKLQRKLFVLFRPPKISGNEESGGGLGPIDLVATMRRQVMFMTFAQRKASKS